MLDVIRAEFEDRTWQAFWRVSVGGESATNVADDLGVSVAAVYKAKSRVLARLRQVLSSCRSNLVKCCQTRALYLLEGLSNPRRTFP